MLRFYDHSDSRVNGNLDETAKKVCGALRRPPYIPAMKDGGLRRTGLKIDNPQNKENGAEDFFLRPKLYKLG